MKHFSQYLLSALLLLCLTMLTGCEYREVVTADKYDELIEEDNSCLYVLDIDWSEMDELPTGMTVHFYPSDGRFPYIRLSNEVEHLEVVLPQDEYRVLVFNQSVNEFASLSFTGEGAWDTFMVEAKEFDSQGESRIDRLYKLESQANSAPRYVQNSDGTRAKVCNSRLKVKGLGTATATMSSEQALPTQAPTRAKVCNSRLKVTPGINRMTVSVRVQGLSTSTLNLDMTPTVAAVNGALTGLASGMMMTTGDLTSSSLTQELDEWVINSVNTPSAIGSVICEFGVFGISPQVTGINHSRTVTMMNAETYTESSEEDDTRNILYLNFRLTNGTYVPFRFDVTDRIREQLHDDYIELTLDIGINLTPGEEDELDDPLHLPDNGLPYGGLGISVKDWGETENQEIIMQ